MYIFDIRDKEGRGSKRDKDVMAFAEEILVTKSDLEEKTQSMAELKTKVEELTMQSEYQLRLKDLNYNEKLKEATEKFTQERGCHCHCPNHRHLLHLHSPPTSSLRRSWTATRRTTSCCCRRRTTWRWSMRRRSSSSRSATSSSSR